MVKTLTPYGPPQMRFGNSTPWERERSAATASTDDVRGWTFESFRFHLSSFVFFFTLRSFWMVKAENNRGEVCEPCMHT